MGSIDFESTRFLFRNSPRDQTACQCLSTGLQASGSCLSSKMDKIRSNIDFCVFRLEIEVYLFSAVPKVV